VNFGSAVGNAKRKKSISLIFLSKEIEIARERNGDEEK
jgi:hypothetical protein